MSLNIIQKFKDFVETISKLKFNFNKAYHYTIFHHYEVEQEQRAGGQGGADL